VRLLALLGLRARAASYTVTFQAKAGIGSASGGDGVHLFERAISSSTSATVNVVNGEQPLSTALGARFPHARLADDYAGQPQYRLPHLARRHRRLGCDRECG